MTGATMAGTGAFADEIQKLPGVNGDYRIATPAPQPEPDDPLPAGRKGTFKIGDTEVKISGSMAIDIGVGGTGLPRH